MPLEWWISCALRRLNLKTASPKNTQEAPNPLSLGLLWNCGRLPDLENKNTRCQSDLNFTETHAFFFVSISIPLAISGALLHRSCAVHGSYLN